MQPRHSRRRGGEVILHEPGHQIHFSASDEFFSSVEAGGISEGFADYWAATVTEWALDQAGMRRRRIRPASRTGTPSRTARSTRRASGAWTAT